MAVDPYRIHRGAILEEVILYILSRNGYLPVVKVGNDQSLDFYKGALRVKGRGSQHQIDAIADARYSPPFCHQQCLLIEAKFLSKNVGLNVIRNATGVIKDVSEFWVPVEDAPNLKRYHYMYGVFSKTEFSKPSQQYAFAHDVYLLPLERNRFFKPIVQAIANFGDAELDKTLKRKEPKPKNIRKYLRKRLLPSINFDEPVFRPGSLSADHMTSLDDIVNVAKTQSHGYMTTLGGSFPVFLMAEMDLNSMGLDDQTEVEIYYDQQGWEIRRRHGGTLFSFDLPAELFQLYADSGNLSAEKAIQMKGEQMADFDILLYSENRVEVKKFILSKDWLENITTSLIRARLETFE